MYGIAPSGSKPMLRLHAFNYPPRSLTIALFILMEHPKKINLLIYSSIICSNGRGH